MSERSNHPEQGFSRLAGGLFAAFSLPTVAQLATQHDVLAVPLVLVLRLAVPGLLLAGFQLTIGELAAYPRALADAQNTYNSVIDQFPV